MEETVRRRELQCIWAANAGPVALGAFDGVLDSLNVQLFGTPEEIRGQRAQVAVAKQAAKLLAASLGPSPGQLVSAVMSGHSRSARPKSRLSGIAVQVYAIALV